MRYNVSYTYDNGHRQLSLYRYSVMYKYTLAEIVTNWRYNARKLRYPNVYYKRWRIVNHNKPLDRIGRFKIAANKWRARVRRVYNEIEDNNSIDFEQFYKGYNLGYEYYHDCDVTGKSESFLIGYREGCTDN